MKKWVLDNLPMIWVVAVFVIGMALVANQANATEKESAGKTKAEWHALYVEAGCFKEGMNFFEKEVCKSKVFQKTNWTESKYQLKGFFEKLPLN
tara:strand:- start:377 stop:658 length:282 start_codon:yes stop_codon:yes gene_type:complete